MRHISILMIYRVKCLSEDSQPASQPAIPFAHVFPAITVRWSGEREREGHGDQFFAGSDDEAFLYTSLRDLLA
jgi:hypothetical protein